MSTRQKINKIKTNHARENISLDGEWEFKLDPKDVGKKQEWFKNNNLHWDRIEVPGCWQAQGFGYKINPGPGREDPFEGRKLKAEYTGTAWYKRGFVLSDNIDNRKIFLKIGGIHPAGEIWINEKFIGSHADGFISYKVDITDYVISGNNKLAIRVYEKNRFLCGIFDWIDKWSGIYGRVNLEITNKLMIEDVFRAVSEIVTPKRKGITLHG
ncbi:MAG: hypothetical protein L6437_03010 [Kiritimatiellae bacterium]|nr:hypothetical protein [Kiritimatiellia bacterium]